MLSIVLGLLARALLLALTLPVVAGRAEDRDTTRIADRRWVRALCLPQRWVVIEVQVGPIGRAGDQPSIGRALAVRTRHAIYPGATDRQDVPCDEQTEKDPAELAPAHAIATCGRCATPDLELPLVLFASPGGGQLRAPWYRAIPQQRFGHLTK